MKKGGLDNLAFTWHNESKKNRRKQQATDFIHYSTDGRIMTKRVGKEEKVS